MRFLRTRARPGAYSPDPVAAVTKVVTATAVNREALGDSNMNEVRASGPRSTVQALMAAHSGEYRLAS